MNKIYVFSIFSLFLFFNNTISYAQFVTDSSNKNTNGSQTKQQKSTIPSRLDNQKKYIKDPPHLGVWVNYQQQFGVLNDKFITIGGPSFGFNLGRHFLIGGGFYSYFGQSPLTAEKDHSLIYGGGIVGIRWNPQHPIVFRTQVLVGAVGFDVLSREVPGFIETRTTSLIVVPEVAFDIRLFGHLYMSLSVVYRYIHDLPEAWSDFKELGALSGNVSVGLSF